MPYAGATARTKCAPATAPRIDAFLPLLSMLFPAMNAEPPSDHWIITGELILAPASKTAFTDEDETQLNAGMANLCSLAYSNNAQAVSPVMTPAFIPGMSQMPLMVSGNCEN